MHAPFGTAYPHAALQQFVNIHTRPSVVQGYVSRSHKATCKGLTRLRTAVLQGYTLVFCKATHFCPTRLHTSTSQGYTFLSRSINESTNGNEMPFSSPAISWLYHPSSLSSVTRHLPALSLSSLSPVTRHLRGDDEHEIDVTASEHRR